MKTFTNQLDLTAFWESFSPTAYKDAAGVITLGYGQARTLPDGTPITPDMTCTEEQAKEWLKTIFEDKSYVVHWHYGLLEGAKLDAITDYCYNVGLGQSPNLCNALLAKDYDAASTELLNAIYVKGKPLLGLLLRRISEYNTFLTGQYIAFEKGDPISQDLKDKLLSMNSNPQGIAMINDLKVI